jgi:hypothetical protein
MLPWVLTGRSRSAARPSTWVRVGRCQDPLRRPCATSPPARPLSIPLAPSGFCSGPLLKLSRWVGFSLWPFPVSTLTTSARETAYPGRIETSAGRWSRRTGKPPSWRPLGEALDCGWRLEVRCARGPRDGMKRIRECVYGAGITNRHTRSSEFEFRARRGSFKLPPGVGASGLEAAWGEPRPNAALFFWNGYFVRALLRRTSRRVPPTPRSPASRCEKGRSNPAAFRFRASGSWPHEPEARP